MIKSNLAVLMAKNEINITELHKATGISRNTISAIYNNTAKGIQYDTLDKLCTYFNVDSNEILEYVLINIYIGDNFTDEYGQEFFLTQINNHNGSFESTIQFNLENQKDLYGNIKYILNLWLKDIIFEEISKIPKNKFEIFVSTQIIRSIINNLNLNDENVDIFMYDGKYFNTPAYSFTYKPNK